MVGLHRLPEQFAIKTDAADPQTTEIYTVVALMRPINLVLLGWPLLRQYPLAIFNTVSIVSEPESVKKTLFNRKESTLLLY